MGQCSGMTPERGLVLLTPKARGAASVDLAVRVIHNPDASRCWSELSLMVIATQAVRPGVVLDQTAALVEPSRRASGGCVGHHRL